MVKTITPAMQTHLEQSVTTLTTCWYVKRRDGVILYFTDHDRDIIYEGNTYKSEFGYNRTDIANDPSLNVDNLDIEGFLNSNALDANDIRNGLYDYAEVRVFAVNWKDLTMGDIKLRRGFLGEVLYTDTGRFKAELRSLTQALSQNILQVYQPTCRADVGDKRCKFPIQPTIRANSTALALGDFIRVPTSTSFPLGDLRNYQDRIYEVTVAGTTAASQPSYNTTLNATTVDGTATLKATEAWSRTGIINTVTTKSYFTLTNNTGDSRANANGWFTGGVLTFVTGANAGKSIEIKNWEGTGLFRVTLYIPTLYDIAPGDIVTLYPGCDKKVSTCSAKFAILNSINFPIGQGNVNNFRGEPHIPPSDKLNQPGEVV